MLGILSFTDFYNTVLNFYNTVLSIGHISILQKVFILS